MCQVVAGTCWLIDDQTGPRAPKRHLGASYSRKRVAGRRVVSELLLHKNHLSNSTQGDLTNAAHTMILTQCAACAKPLAYDAPRRVAASVR